MWRRFTPDLLKSFCDIVVGDLMGFIRGGICEKLQESDMGTENPVFQGPLSV